MIPELNLAGSAISNNDVVERPKRLNRCTIVTIDNNAFKMKVHRNERSFNLGRGVTGREEAPTTLRSIAERKVIPGISIITIFGN